MHGYWYKTPSSGCLPLQIWSLLSLTLMLTAVHIDTAPPSCLPSIKEHGRTANCPVSENIGVCGVQLPTCLQHVAISVCHNKVAQTDWLKTTNLFSQVLEARSPKSKYEKGGFLLGDSGDSLF
jgi:hypothetical protein